jgi:hypothetical protein
MIDTDTCAMVTVACADCVGSATDTADTVTVAGAGITAGAVYSPLLDIVPTVALPPGMPLTCQVTALLVLLLTVAVKLCVPVATSTFAELGAMATLSGDVIVTPAKPDSVEFALDTAVTVTVG